MTKGEFIKEMAKLGNIRNVEAEKYCNLFLDTFKHCIKKYGCVKFNGTGRFLTKEYKEKPARNPHTGETVIVPKHKKVKFMMSEAFFIDEDNNE